MKRRITLSLALTLSVVLLSLMSSDSSANAQQPPQRFRFDTGLIVPGPHQVLRVTVAWDLNNDDGNGGRVRFTGVEYIQGACNNGACKHTVSSVTDNTPILLGPGEAASFDISPAPNSSGVRVVVMSDRRNVRVNAMVIDSLTGDIVSIAHTTTTMYWP